MGPETAAHGQHHDMGAVDEQQGQHGNDQGSSEPLELAAGVVVAVVAGYGKLPVAHIVGVERRERAFPAHRAVFDIDQRRRAASQSA